jgi:predicted Zn-dependent protease
MLRTMRRITRYRMGGEVPQYLLTHPNPEARMSYVESLVELDAKRPDHKPYPKADDFAFLRFKYRVLIQSMDHDRLRIHCANTLASGQEGSQQAVMAHYGLALLESEAHNTDEALRQLAAVQARYPERDILEVDRAAILINANRMAEARQVLDQAVRRDPTDMYATSLLIRVQLLRRLQAALPEYPQLYFDLGRVEANRGHEGASLFYLGKYNLYRGRDKIARQYLTRSSKDTSVPEKLRNEAKVILDRLEELDKGT